MEVNEGQQARVAVARLLAQKGVSSEPKYPDISTREKAWAVANSFVEGSGVMNIRPDLTGCGGP